jgi:hypothetical protein
LIQALLLAATLAQAAPPPAADPSIERALPVLERTKTTRATYALYSWAWVEDADGGNRDGWLAEFHRGGLHRVETPDVRVVADCDAQTGTAVDVRSGERSTGRHFALIACGINTARPMREATWLGSGPSRFGPVDRLRIVDDEEERFYAVDRDGILVGAEIHTPGGGWCLQSEPLAVERSLPEGDLFSVVSLDRSFVPEHFRRAPERRVGDLWTSGRSCPDARPPAPG